jgi:hypothetical protein
MIAPAYDDFGANPRASTYPSSLGPCSPKDPCLSSTPCRCSSWGRRGRGSRPVWPRSDPWPPPRLVSCGESSLRRRSPSRRPRIRAQSPPMQQQQSSSTYPPMLVRAPRELSLHTFRPWASDRILNKLSPRDLPGKHACHAADAILFCAGMTGADGRFPRRLPRGRHISKHSINPPPYRAAGRRFPESGRRKGAPWCARRDPPWRSG